MKALKQFMRKNAYKLVYLYASVTLPWIVKDLTSVIFFGELPFPTQEYMSIQNKEK